ncbi:FGGY-family carbohydrate kinase [Alicyclobacillus dauci]|uniref:FGGY family carbohydrate kinase n=1 Tax=Alicyclobacillus dauci TaxID=1475485 RepID=A0ABY6Z5E4_9BACL|nr:FGGY family carbohydrate kinase [Alicyclobacillus dauci]WAH37975.1 FGGY family carbohydrate kinase [Alicyclobacillus dauci]
MKFIGVDLGTTHTKAIVYDDVLNKVVASEIANTPVQRDHTGFSRNPIDMRNTVCKLIRDVVRQVSEINEIAALSVASMGEEVVLLDEDCEPIGDIITWFDQRGTLEYTEIYNRVSDEFYKGVYIDPSFSLFKLLWIKDHRPDDLKRCRKVVDLGGYILGCLSGNYQVDWSHASRTGIFNIRSKRWNEEICLIAELDGAIFPSLVPSGIKLGTLTPQSIRDTGLPPHTVIVSGGHDHLCAAYASGVRTGGELFISAGTSEAHLLLSTKLLNEGSQAPSIEQGCFVDDKHYYVHAGLPSGHVFAQWRNLLYKGVAESEMYAEIERVSEANTDIKFVFSSDLKKQSLMNFKYTTDRATLMRSILEGLALKSSEMIDNLESILKHRIDTVTVSGHPARVPLWKEIRSSILNRPLSVIEEVETTALGAALLAVRACHPDISPHIAERSIWPTTNLWGGTA